MSRFDWVNPHMYLVVATKGPDGQPALVEGEGVGITQALVDGLDRNALTPGTPDPLVIGAGLVAGGVIVGLSGVLATYSVVRQPPAGVLAQAG